MKKNLLYISTKAFDLQFAPACHLLFFLEVHLNYNFLTIFFNYRKTWFYVNGVNNYVCVPCVFRHFLLYVFETMLCFLFPKSFNANSTVFLVFRSSLPEVFCKKGVLRNFTKFTGKHKCQSLFFKKAAGLMCFPMSFLKIVRTPFFLEQL